MVVHTNNLSYLGGRGKSTARSRPAQAKLVKPYLKNKIKFKKKKGKRDSGYSSSGRVFA
jgi:hypothetical protein